MFCPCYDHFHGEESRQPKFNSSDIIHRGDTHLQLGRAGRRVWHARPGFLAHYRTAMPVSHLPKTAITAALPRDIRTQILTSVAEPPSGDDWLHEIKHDGWRLIAIIDGRGGLRLLSRQGLDHTALFRAPFDKLAAAGHAMVLDGEIAGSENTGSSVSWR